jgi:hypothetical protein
MADREVAKVIHYYDKIMVALIKLTDALSVGDTVKFVYRDKEFSQIIVSMEVDHVQVTTAQAGAEVAVKAEQVTHEGAQVLKIE